MDMGLHLSGPRSLNDIHGLDTPRLWNRIKAGEDSSCWVCTESQHLHTFTKFVDTAIKTKLSFPVRSVRIRQRNRSYSLLLINELKNTCNVILMHKCLVGLYFLGFDSFGGDKIYWKRWKEQSYCIIWFIKLWRKGMEARIGDEAKKNVVENEIFVDTNKAEHPFLWNSRKQFLNHLQADTTCTCLKMVWYFLGLAMLG